MTEGKVRTMEKIGEFRLIAAHQHPQTLGPTLQEAYMIRRFIREHPFFVLGIAYILGIYFIYLFGYLATPEALR